jgi:methyl-accepting chemotaxis protein
MKNLSIGKKLTVTFGIILLLYVLTLAIAIFWGMRSVSDSFAEFYSGSHQVTQKAMDLRRGLQVIEKNIARILLERNTKTVQPRINEMEEAVASNIENCNFLYENLVLQENLHELDQDVTQHRLEQITKQLEEAQAIREKILDLVDQGAYDSAVSVYRTLYVPLSENVQYLSIQLSQTAQTAGDDFY